MASTDLMGPAEVAEYLGIKRQNVRVQLQRAGVTPTAELKAGPVWQAADLAEYRGALMRLRRERAERQKPKRGRVQVNEMTPDELRAFVESAPFRPVKGTPEGPLHKPPDPHEYVIRSWRSVDDIAFDRFVHTIRALGYRGRYTAPYNNRTMTNWYLAFPDSDGVLWAYWFIRPQMLNRCRAELRQHEPLSEQRPVNEGLADIGKGRN